ncbi:MAG: hypothetical protein ACU0GG_08270 [Paracoccaceae bacterium]
MLNRTCSSRWDTAVVSRVLDASTGRKTETLVAIVRRLEGVPGAQLALAEALRDVAAIDYAEAAHLEQGAELAILK